MRHITLLLLLLIPRLSYQIQLKLCGQNQSTAYLCKVQENYSNLDFPQPTPCQIQIDLRIQEVIGIEEEHQLINIILKLVLRWNDSRISYDYNEENKGSYFPWVLLNKSYTSALWRPNIHWSNAIKILKMPSLNQNVIGSFWYMHPGHFLHQEYLQLSISCDMKFSNYPFDSHNCSMQLTNIIGNLDLVILQTPKIYARDEKTNPDGTSFEAQNDKLQFELKIKALNSSYNSEFGLKYSKAEVEINLRRKADIISNLLSSYYAPTSAFAALSLISYCVDPNNVPGRMALLITLCLIITNIYNSLQSPKTFGYIEIWYIGIQFPVIMGLVEYGIILALTKFGNKYLHGKPSLFQTMDLVTFILAVVILAGFNLAYWFHLH